MSGRVRSHAVRGRQIITDNVRPAFNMVISSAMRLRNSLAAEIALLLFAVLVGPTSGGVGSPSTPIPGTRQ